MDLESKKNVIISLGKFIRQFSLEKKYIDDTVLNNDIFYDDFISIIEGSINYNGWFTSENVYFSIQNWGLLLTEENINNWLINYKINETNTKKIGLVLAGNIPLVGFHDFISVILSNHKAIIKTSSNDQKILPFLVNYMISIDGRIKNYVEFADTKLEDFDAVIATGSNNTARYFEYYFRNKPSIIRKNRNSIAILDGNETEKDLILLGEDIFRYFGLGCRNVSKLFVPKGYSFDAFFNAMYLYRDLIKYEKYTNNYDYNKAVFLMSNYKLLDNGFLILKEDTQQYSSPISSIFYEYYTDIKELQTKIDKDNDLLQCIVSNNLLEKSIGFGQTQKPSLSDYADGIDTLKFLTELR